MYNYNRGNPYISRSEVIGPDFPGLPYYIYREREHKKRIVPNEAEYDRYYVYCYVRGYVPYSLEYLQSRAYRAEAEEHKKKRGS